MDQLNIGKKIGYGTLFLWVHVMFSLTLVDLVNSVSVIILRGIRVREKLEERIC